jgi:hypothetical protein
MISACFPDISYTPVHPGQSEINGNDNQIQHFKKKKRKERKEVTLPVSVKLIFKCFLSGLAVHNMFSRYSPYETAFSSGGFLEGTGEIISQVGTSPTSLTFPQTHSDSIELIMAGIGTEAPGSDIMIV